MIETILLGITVVVVVYLAFVTQVRPLMNSSYSNNIKVPEKRDQYIIIDGRFGDVVRPIEIMHLGDRKVKLKVLAEAGEEMRIYEKGELHFLSEKQAMFGTGAPILVTKSIIEEQINKSDLRESPLFQQIISKNNELQKEVELLQFEKNKLESAINMDTKGVVDNIVAMNRGLTSNLIESQREKVMV